MRCSTSGILLAGTSISLPNYNAGTGCILYGTLLGIPKMNKMTGITQFHLQIAARLHFVKYTS